MSALKDQAASETQEISRKQVPEDKRQFFLPTAVGARYMLGFEFYVYNLAQQQIVGYVGGYWEFYNLSNGGWYMAPRGEGAMSVACPNGFAGQLGHDAVGIAMTLIAVNHLLWTVHASDPEHGKALQDAFYALREYAAQHEEAAGIFGVID